MPSRPVTNLLGLAVLAYLTQQPMHAYELQRRLRDNDAASTFKLSYGALYSVVRQLAEAGLIAPTRTGRRGNLPKHTVYELTDAGRAETRDWLRELLGQPRHQYPAFAAALSLVVVLPPDEVAELLQARLAQLAELAAGIRELIAATVDGGVDPIFLVEDDYRAALLDAEMAFIHRLIARIADPAGGWADSWQSYHQDSGRPDQPAAETADKEES